MAGEFEEIGHSGGTITFDVRVDDQGRTSVQTTMSSMRPVPVALIGIWALPANGIPVGIYDLGFGSRPPPLPGCLPVVIASDNEGKFGHLCPACGGYWRSGPWPNVCPYCAVMAPTHDFLSGAQKRYVQRYCEVLSEALRSDHDVQVKIDMDEVADAVGKEGEKPAFYVSEESQQHKFVCSACEQFNDILGRFGYCSTCGTRNDLVEFEEQAVSGIRSRLKASAQPEDCVRDGVAAFDSFIAQYAKQLAMLVPMIERRRARLLNQRFHDLNETQRIFAEWFGIDLFNGMPESERSFAARMFHRRHVYEHNGGEIDERYLKDSGDSSVRLKQRIHETQKDGHDLLNLLVKMARNAHRGFHEVFPPLPEPTEALAGRKARERTAAAPSERPVR